ncbi:MAG: class I SAM-dependent methyltransferase [Candidatus Heimdallarchaeota archaeon]|nr:class I SAM-dependent methyltransferase [Candidatus Heimdallarchaeota archaeon]
MKESIISEKRDQIKKEWNKVAAGWHKWIPFISTLLKDATDLMLDMANIENGDRVLDIAAGDGDQSFSAIERVGNSGYVLATDISTNLMEYAAQEAKNKGYSNLETKVMDAGNLELPDNSFDAVICRLGLMLIPGYEKVLDEAYRVLKPSSRISVVVFSTPDKSPWISVPAMTAMQRVNASPPPKGAPGLFSLGAPGMITELLHSAGFEDIQVEYLNSSFKLSSAQECTDFLKDIAGAIHAILAPLSDEEQEQTWKDIRQALLKFESEEGFSTSNEVIIAAGMKK